MDLDRYLEALKEKVKDMPREDFIALLKKSGEAVNCENE